MQKIGGGGYHTIIVAQTNPQAIVNFLKIQTGVEILYMTAVTLPRIAICRLYLRIFVDKTIRILTWIVVAICALHGIGSGLITEFVLCHPYSYGWDKTIKGGWCGDIEAGFKYVSVPNLVIDVSLILLPISSLYRLQISRTRKVGLFITFMTGCLYVRPPPPSISAVSYH